jgi:glycosyltransferase involved in cell wall biosynthesis
MKIIYIFRKRGLAFSIEGVFDGLINQLRTINLLAVQDFSVSQAGTSLRSLWLNLRSVRELKADLYHITGDVHYLALALPGPKTVLTIHDCVSLERLRRQRNYIRYALLWLLYYYLPMRRVRTVTVISEKTRSELRRLIGSRYMHKVRVIPNYFDPVFTYRPARFRPAKPVILQIGTAPNKNLHRLIVALAGLDCVLDIVGPLTDISCMLLQEHTVCYTHSERLTRNQIKEKYENCDIVSFVSTYEGFGLPIIEANAVGRVVLTSDIEPMRWVAGQAAHLVDPYCEHSIRGGINRLIHDVAYRDSLIRAGQENIRRFSLEEISRQYAVLYDEIRQATTR